MPRWLQVLMWLFIVFGVLWLFGISPYDVMYVVVDGVKSAVHGARDAGKG